jgi:hypothetical protein
MPPPPTTTNPSWQQYAGRVLGDEFLDAENPHFQGAVVEPLRRESQRNLALERQRLNQAAGGAGRFGGDVWSSQFGRAGELSDRNFNEVVSSRALEQYALERQLQNQMAQTGAGYEQGIRTAQIGADAARQTASTSANAGIRQAEINAELQRELLAEQLGFSREELAETFGFARQGLAADIARIQGEQGLDWAALEQQGGLSALQLMAGLAGEGGQQQLAALGLVPGLEASGYTGLTTAGSMFSDLGRQEAAAAGTANQNAMNQWNYERNNEQQALLDWLGIALPISGAGGSSTGTGSQSGPQTDPLAAGISQGLSGYLQARDLFGGGASSAAGGASSAAGGVGAAGPVSTASPGNPFAGVGYDPATGPAGSPAAGQSGGGASAGSGGGLSFGGDSTPGGAQATARGMPSNDPAGEISETIGGLARLGQPGYYYLPSGDTSAPQMGPWWLINDPYVQNRGGW